MAGHGADKAHIAEYLDGGQGVRVEPDAPSQSPGDVWLRLTYTYQGYQCQSTIGLTVLHPDPGTSSWTVSDVCNQVLGLENDTEVLAAGKVVTFTVKDQFGNVMAGETAKWSEWRYLVERDPSMIGPPTQNQPMNANGQDLDAHVAMIPWPTEQQWTCAMPTQMAQWVHFDQRITINGWGASACADVSSHLPAFWRFRVKKWLGTDWNGNLAATASVSAW